MFIVLPMISRELPPLSLDVDAGEGEKRENRNFDFIVENFSKFSCFQWQQQRGLNLCCPISNGIWICGYRRLVRNPLLLPFRFHVTCTMSLNPLDKIGFPLHSSFGISAVKISGGSWRPARDYFSYFVPKMLQWWPIIGIRRLITTTFWNIQFCGAKKSVVGKSRDWLMSVIPCGRLKNGCKEAKSCETSRRCEPESRRDKWKVEN